MVKENKYKVPETRGEKGIAGGERQQQFYKMKPKRQVRSWDLFILSVTRNHMSFFSF